MTENYRAKHVNSTQKGPKPDLNPGPFSQSHQHCTIMPTLNCFDTCISSQRIWMWKVVDCFFGSFFYHYSFFYFFKYWGDSLIYKLLFDPLHFLTGINEMSPLTELETPGQGSRVAICNLIPMSYSVRDMSGDLKRATVWAHSWSWCKCFCFYCWVAQVDLIV